MDIQLTQAQINALVKGTWTGDPFSIYGMHPLHDHKGLFILTFQPQAQRVAVMTPQGTLLQEMTRLHADGLFAATFDGHDFFPYVFQITLFNGNTYTVEDTYSFWPVLGDTDLYLFSEGTHTRLYEHLGAHLMTHQGVQGVSFAVWAPNAKRVSVVGNFNDWDGRRHLMRPRGSSGLWELFIPRLKQWDLYKYELIGPHDNLLPLKADPFGFAFEMRPKTGTLVFDNGSYQWHDDRWLDDRPQRQSIDKPMSIYEVHLGSWRRDNWHDHQWLSYRQLIQELPAYIKKMGFTHVEFLPVAEYPFDGSWGYQETGLFAPTSRYGTPDDFKALIDTLHQNGIGVIMDWVPAHFPKDAFGLAQFDGTALYEHADPRKGEHMDWGTKIYNYGRNEVQEFLINNALFWIREYHIDGLRVDAVASMLYLDYSRKDGAWIPNCYGGRENLEAIDFLKRLNTLVYAQNTGAITIAEESTAWPGVSRPVYNGGLGFGYKWNMGWMHDTLGYMQQNPVYRKYHQNELTFSMLYAFTENFILPLSHDEVVHGKGSMIGKMPGDTWQQFAGLRAYYAFMYMHPGKKLLFMGDEIAQRAEWRYQDALDWDCLNDKNHLGVQRLVQDLNALYTKMSALQCDCDGRGFEWIDGSDTDNSVISFMRKSADGRQLVVVVCNFTPVPRYQYQVGVPQGGTYRCILNTDGLDYHGSGLVCPQSYQAFEPGWNFKAYRLSITLPPLAVVAFTPEQAGR